MSEPAADPPAPPPSAALPPAEPAASDPVALLAATGEAVPPLSPPLAAELIGVGSPLVDLLLQVEHEFLTAHVSGAKGGMEWAEATAIEELIAKSGRAAARVPGGAASNTSVGAANLGIRAAFVGACGNDALAAFFQDALRGAGCEPRLVSHDHLPTGQVLSLVTPDAERTMRTCLGAAAAMAPAHFTPELFAGARIVLLEGYALFNHDLAHAVCRAATAAGAELALDFASFEVVKANRAVLDDLLREHVDILFANQDEAAAWNPGGIDAALSELCAHVDTVVIKLGADGARIGRGADGPHAERVTIAAHHVDTVVDTTGAGDCFAAGFLAGRLRGFDLERCGRLGARCGAAAVQVVGAHPTRESWQRLRGWFDAWN